MLIVGACLIVSSFLGAMTPLKMRDLAANYESRDLYYTSIWQLFMIFMGVYLNRVFYQLGLNKYLQLLMQNTRSICYEKWLHAYDVKTKDSSRNERYPQGEVISRIMNDTESLRELMTSGTFGIFIDIFFVISSLSAFISLNETSGVAIAMAEIISALLLVWGSRYMRKIFMEVRKSRAEMSRLLSNMVGGIKETFYTRHENYASKRGAVVFQDFLKKMLTANVWDAGYYSTAESLYPLMLAFVVFLFPYSNITEAAIIFAIVDLIQRSIGPVKDVAAKIANIQRAYTGLTRIDEFLCDLDEDMSSAEHKPIGLLELKEVEINIQKFEYPRKKSQETKFALTNISFKATPGELVGIVGLSGCGKSTLLNIMAANIFPDEGEIKLIAKDGASLSFPGLGVRDTIHYREQVGIVSQDSHIFSDTVAFNICMRREIPEEFAPFWRMVEEKIPYILTWGIKPNELLNQRSLSLGQKQLLAAIRSCFLKKPVVLFDEISSGLDGELELALREMVRLIQINSLTFIVAHRLETITHADNIIVLDDGRVVDTGKHDDLMVRCEVYSQFLAELSHSKVC